MCPRPFAAEERHQSAPSGEGRLICPLDRPESSLDAPFVMKTHSNVPVTVRARSVPRADVFSPSAPRAYPALMTHRPYGRAQRSKMEA